MRVLLDTNLILDIAMRRPGLFAGSERALKRCEAEGHAIFISWHTVSNLFYILRRDRGREKTVDFIRYLLGISMVATVGHTDVLRAISYGLNDFEDALQLSAAEGCGADVILTRNKGDFGAPSSLAVLSPEEFAPP